MGSQIQEKMWSKVCGFVTDIFDSEFPVVFVSKKVGKTAVQIHYNGSGHFITSSCCQNDLLVHIYDSLLMNIEGDLKLQL